MLKGLSDLISGKTTKTTSNIGQLHQAIKDGDTEAFENFFKECGSKYIDEIGEDGCTAITLSAKYNRPEMAQFLMEKFANPNIPRDITKRVLGFAILYFEEDLKKEIESYTFWCRNNPAEFQKERDAVLEIETNSWQMVEVLGKNTDWQEVTPGNSPSKIISNMPLEAQLETYRASSESR